MTAEPKKRSWPVSLLRERSFQIAVVLWAAGSYAVFPLSGGTLPFNRPGMAGSSIERQVIFPHVVLAIFLILLAVIYLLTRKRAIPDLAARAPNVPMAVRETLALWGYGAIGMVLGRVIGMKVFGEGIGMHLNGSLFGATRVQSPAEVWTWAVYNFMWFAVVPCIVFCARGYSREALNLKSTNLGNDTLVIVVVLAIMLALDLSGGSLLKLDPHQILVGGAISFVMHLLGTGLPVMVFIYAIMMPRYARITRSAAATTILGAASYAAVHIFEYWTVYDSVPHAILSVIFVFLTFMPPGLVKSYLTLRTGNAWVHLWAFHAISPHVTGDTPNIVNVFRIQ
ncbi:MAG TPA: hypothetical protein VEG64_06875 [Candidatus Sulfotelmatobacter sp.]|nr:hypothetical protein [Candidatus Sulfotelmatobacter sp.]